VVLAKVAMSDCAMVIFADVSKSGVIVTLPASAVTILPVIRSPFFRKIVSARAAVAAKARMAQAVVAWARIVGRIIVILRKRFRGGVPCMPG